MNEWIEELQDIATRGGEACIVTVASVRGSTPRDAGAKMIVTSEHSFATIGGGELEYQCTRLACKALGDNDPPQVQLRKFTLGTNCGQCCGGIAEILFEPLSGESADWLVRLAELHAARIDVAIVTRIDGGGKFLVTESGCEPFAATVDMAGEVLALARSALLDNAASRVVSARDRDGVERRYMIEPVTGSDLNIALFGAGHVGAATVTALAKLDGNVRWIDSRRGMLRPGAPANVTAIESAQPALEVGAMPAGAFYLVMTHSHALDFEICDRILRRGDFAYCGLIGSRSKRRRFERLMRQQDMPAKLLDRLTCPIGIAGIDGKRPEEIAVAVAAQVLQLRTAAQQDSAEDNANVHYFR